MLDMYLIWRSKFWYSSCAHRFNMCINITLQFLPYFKCIPVCLFNNNICNDSKSVSCCNLVKQVWCILATNIIKFNFSESRSLEWTKSQQLCSQHQINHFTQTQSTLLPVYPYTLFSPFHGIHYRLQHNLLFTTH